MNDQSNHDVTRRRFLQGAAAVSLGSVASSFGAEAAEEKGKLPTSTLGKSKLKVTKVSYGSLNTSGGGGKALLKATIEAGINMVHTSSTYNNGNTIKAVGAFFDQNKGIRDKLVLCLKGAPTRIPSLKSELDDMLKALSTDHVDVYLPVLHKPDKSHMEALMKLHDELKKQGKIKFAGFVCHGAMNEVLEMVQANAGGYFDAALLGTELIIASKSGSGKAKDEGQRFVENLAKVKKQGLGVISMKSKAREAMAKGAQVFQAHAKALLAGGADTVCFTFASLQQVDHIKHIDLASGMTAWERRVADAFHSGHEQACLMCGNCTRSCPQGLPVNDLMRIRMYHDEHRDPGYARQTYDELGGDLAALASNCGSCTACNNACPVGLASAEKVRYVTSLFG
jgi:predicted aldo/keto reductase-like oxidoreductase